VNKVMLSTMLGKGEERRRRSRPEEKDKRWATCGSSAERQLMRKRKAQVEQPAGLALNVSRTSAGTLLHKIAKTGAGAVRAAIYKIKICVCVRSSLRLSD
jgi:hypothetical protein